MSTTHEDESQRHGLTFLILLVALVVGGVVGLGVSKARHKTPTQPVQQTAPVPVTNVFKLYFDTGSATLPADAQPVLDQAADRARSNPQARVTLSGFHDATGDAQVNEELAKNRALAVRHGLEANGVSPQAIELAKPRVTSGGPDPKQARRVDITVH